MLFTTDTLSHAPRPFSDGDIKHEDEMGYLMEVCVRDLPANQRVPFYSKTLQDDPACVKVI